MKSKNIIFILSSAVILSVVVSVWWNVIFLPTKSKAFGPSIITNTVSCNCMCKDLYSGINGEDMILCREKWVDMGWSSFVPVCGSDTTYFPFAKTIAQCNSKDNTPCGGFKKPRTSAEIQRTTAGKYFGCIIPTSSPSPY